MNVAEINCHSNTDLCAQLNVEYGTYYYPAQHIEKQQGSVSLIYITIQHNILRSKIYSKLSVCYCCRPIPPACSCGGVQQPKKLR